MHETEIKLRAGSAAEARARLERAGFVQARPRAFEANLLLDTVDSRLRTGREVLRVREFDGEAIVTYKGAALAGTRHKSREEIETTVGDAATILALFARLGFRPTYRYEKFRSEFGRPGEQGMALLDETPIGVFFELEGEPGWIDAAAQSLGYDEAAYVNDSYATLYRQYCAERSLPVGAGMVFGEDLSASPAAN